METTLDILIQILSAIGTGITILTLYRVIVFLIGLLKTKKYPTAKQFHPYAVCVAARNEEKVILNLLDSIAAQDYPKELLQVFIVADNCTDKTFELCEGYEKIPHLTVYRHDNPNERTKGFALKYLFEQIKKDYGTDAFEGYFIFDADNVLARDYITRMNEAFDSGEKIVTSLRRSKNDVQNWISFSYAIHWLRTCLFENRGKGFLSLSCRIQGTGFLFSNELVKNGWQYTSLTEDRAFCTDAVIKGYHIAYCDEASFYDEQPYSLKVALRQRVRWSKGHLQSSVENCPKLLKNMFRGKRVWASYDCFWLNFPRHIEKLFRSLLSWSLRIALAALCCRLWGEVKGILLAWLLSYAKEWGLHILQALFVVLYYHKTFKNKSVFKIVIGVLLFPTFDIIGKWTNYIALFRKVEWKPIPHDSVLDVHKL